MNSQEIKLQSKKLKELSKQYGYEIKHSHALEIISQLNNNSNWHVSSLNNPKYIKTGIKELDRDLGGGLKKGTVTSVLGGTNSGTSMFCCSLVCNALRKKRKVLIYQLEGTPGYLTLYILSNLSNIELQKIMKNNLTEKEKTILEKIKTNILDKFLIVKNICKYDYSIEEMTKDIFNERINFKFDLTYIDSAPMIISKQFQENRIALKIIFNQLHNFSKAYDCAIITPVSAIKSAQKRMEENKVVLKASDIRESFDISRMSSNIISLNNTPTEKFNNKMRLFLDKNQQGKNKNIVYNITTDFDHANLII